MHRVKLKYVFSAYYYTNKEYVPEDPHWSFMSIINGNEKVERIGGYEIKTKTITPADEEEYYGETEEERMNKHNFEEKLPLPESE